MQKSSILELSRYNSTDKPSNANWISKLAKPVIINNGDLIQVRDSFIDCQLIDSQSIEIQDDTTLSFQFCYWIQRNGIGQYMITNTENYPYTVNFGNINGDANTTYQNDGLPFILVNINPTPGDKKSGHPVIETASIFLQKGVYERSFLADEITRKFEKVSIKPNTSLDYYIDNGNLTNFQNFTNGSVTIVSDDNGNFTNFTQPTPQPPPYKSTPYAISTFQKQLYLGVWKGNPNQPAPPENVRTCLFYIDENGYYTPCMLKPMTDNDYLPVSNGFFAPITAPNPTGFFFLNWMGADYTMYDAGFIGAPQIQLTYNQQGGNIRYAFDYMHTPIISNTGEVAGVHVQQNDDQDVITPSDIWISPVYASSGLMFVNIYDQNTYNTNGVVEVPLLEQMGFKISDLIPLDDLASVFNPNNLFTNPTYTPFKYSNFLKYTTRQFLTMNSIVSNSSINVQAMSNSTAVDAYKVNIPSSSLLPIINGYNLSSSLNTEPLIASTAPIASLTNSGHYLIEVYGYDSDYIDNEGFRLVKAIVSSYYFSENFASALEDSLIYQHMGESISLQNIQVRILNPCTHNESRNLGSNSSVYLQIIKPITDNQPTQK